MRAPCRAPCRSPCCADPREGRAPAPRGSASRPRRPRAPSRTASRTGGRAGRGDERGPARRPASGRGRERHPDPAADLRGDRAVGERAHARPRTRLGDTTPEHEIDRTLAHRVGDPPSSPGSRGASQSMKQTTSSLGRAEPGEACRAEPGERARERRRRRAIERSRRSRRWIRCRRRSAGNRAACARGPTATRRLR